MRQASGAHGGQGQVEERQGHEHGHEPGHEAYVHEAHGHEHHEPELGFIGKYVFSTDHKVIARQFLFTTLIFMAIGGLLAMLIRTQLAWPWEPIPFLGRLLYPESEGILPPENYLGLVSMHGTIMIFFMIIPLLSGAFGNYLIPLMIGARDMAFPKLNMLSYWILWPAFLMILLALFAPGGGSNAGWTSYAPLSALPEAAPGSGQGQTLWTLAIILVGFGSILGAMNYVTTVVTLRAPGMSMTRLPLSIWALFVTAGLILLATPVLTAALILLMLDRTVGTHFFLPAGGGQVILYQHLFWIYSHPAVYIMILPAMGFVSDILATFARKPLFGYKSMVGAIVAIGFLSFTVWAHHMFVSGMNPLMGIGFMTTTMIIAVPSGVKVFNWLATLWRGSIQFTTPMLNALAFVSMFVIGGLSGIFLAATPVDIFMHDTYFVVAHLHYVLFGGSLFGAFAAITYWFPKMFAREMDERLGKIHFLLTFIGFNWVFFPMHYLGTQGMMRRVADPFQYGFLSHLQTLNQWMTVGAYVLGAAQLIFFFNFAYALVKGRVTVRNPWRANTLEWLAPSPPPHGNWGPAIPVVYNGPYEYSPPGTEQDFLPQYAPTARRPAPAGAAAGGGGAAE